MQTWTKRRAVVAAGAVVGLAVLLLTIAAGGAAAGNGNAKESPQERTTAAISFRNDMRKLWEDHITWTRQVIVSVAAASPDLGPTENRLLQNQSDIGNAIKPFYGDAAGDQLTALLRDHILIAADLLAAAKAGDTAAVQEASDRWYANANDIAAFLSSANPENWPLDEMQTMMKSHLDLTLQEAEARLQGRFADDIAAYDEVHQQILHMADMLSLGIIDQFPKEFR